MENKPNIYSLAEKGIKYAFRTNSNLKAIEVYFSLNKDMDVEIEENSIKNNEFGYDTGFGIRVVDNRGALGFSFANNIEEKKLLNTIKNAMKMMSSGTPDPDFKDIPPSFTKYPKIKLLYDEDIKNLSIEDSANYIQDLIKMCDSDEIAISQSGGFSTSISKTYIFNSNGLEAYSKESMCSISSHMIVKDKITNDTSFGFEYQISRTLKDIDAIKVAQMALNKAKLNLNRRKIKKMKVPLILSPQGTNSLILKPLASAINAETYQYNRSFLVGLRGQTIGSEHLNIEDNALYDGAVGSSSFDGEGVPCQNKRIITRGTFHEKGLLHNFYTASKEGVKSTGNAARSSYSSVPKIGISNFILKKGNISKADLFNDTKYGILLNYTGDRPNLTTGDFSGLILQGNIIENGEIKEPLNETMLAINLLDLFKKIEAVSKESKTYGSFRAPYVKINEVQIVGSVS
ncbi:MAG: TldD/PmbA family protein [Promethearchaeota archaeon]|nr:MAG: TldD/PmbA family protein [Candidatus Lokiarchaeota archaeon]